MCLVRVKVRVQRAIFACPYRGGVVKAVVLLWMGVVLSKEKVI